MYFVKVISCLYLRSVLSIDILTEVQVVFCNLTLFIVSRNRIFDPYDIKVKSSFTTVKVLTLNKI